MTTLLRLMASPESRRFVPPSLVLHALSGHVVQHAADPVIVPAHRARWAACRHLLVMVMRTWAVSGAGDPASHVVPAVAADNKVDGL